MSPVIVIISEDASSWGQQYLPSVVLPCFSTSAFSLFMIVCVTWEIFNKCELKWVILFTHNCYYKWATSQVQLYDKDSPTQLKETSCWQKREQPSPLILFMSSHSSPWPLHNGNRRGYPGSVAELRLNGERYYRDPGTSVWSHASLFPWILVPHQNEINKRNRFIKHDYFCLSCIFMTKDNSASQLATMLTFLFYIYVKHN